MEVLKAQAKVAEEEAQARRNTELRLEAFTRATNDAFYEMNADWSVMFQLNGQNFRADTDSADADWLEKHVHPLDQPEVKDAIRRAIAAKSQFNLEHRVLRSDGRLGWTASRAIPMLDASGAIVSWLGTASDITDRKLAESVLMRAEKLAAVGRLASTIAHEINNPAGSCNEFAVPGEGVCGQSPGAGLARAGDAELRRVSAITSQTLRFHRQSTKPTPVSSASLFKSTLVLYEARLRNSHVLVETSERTEAPVLCFEGDIRQIVSNLVSNAIDAMPNGGRLLARSREGTNWLTGKKGQVLTIADSGIGMEPETQARALEAFYTTKGVGGSGLGLWISGQIIERHKGRISLRSSQKDGCHGTVVSLFLPYTDEY